MSPPITVAMQVDYQQVEVDCASGAGNGSLPVRAARYHERMRDLFDFECETRNFYVWDCVIERSKIVTCGPL